ncbi:MPN domain-containing protein [Salix suchowensis]|nr:MPN domain-containing protein [Salix suchowensis]
MDNYLSVFLLLLGLVIRAPYYPVLIPHAVMISVRSAASRFPPSRACRYRSSPNYEVITRHGLQDNEAHKQHLESKKRKTKELQNFAHRFLPAATGTVVNFSKTFSLRLAAPAKAIGFQNKHVQTRTWTLSKSIHDPHYLTQRQDIGLTTGPGITGLGEHNYHYDKQRRNIIVSLLRAPATLIVGQTTVMTTNTQYTRKKRHDTLNNQPTTSSAPADSHRHPLAVDPTFRLPLNRIQVSRGQPSSNPTLWSGNGSGIDGTGAGAGSGSGSEPNPTVSGSVLFVTSTFPVITIFEARRHLPHSPNLSSIPSISISSSGTAMSVNGPQSTSGSLQVGAQSQPICAGKGIDASAAGLIATIIVPSVIGLIIWVSLPYHRCSVSPFPFYSFLGES